MPPRKIAASKPSADELFNTSYVNKDHIAARYLFEAGPDASPHETLSRESSFYGELVPPPTPSVRVRKISALSDFAPINTRVSSRRRRKAERDTHTKSSEIGFTLFRWPLLFFLFLWIFGEFGLYVLVRQIVNAVEWLFQWSGRKGHLRRELRRAKTYEEWKTAARTMDEYMGFNAWKRIEDDHFYDWTLVKKVRKSLKTSRSNDDARGVLGVLEVCLRANFAGIESTRMYSQSFFGTKSLVESYLEEVVAALQYIRRTSKLTSEEKRRFFRTANRNLGSSALCLSGGASFGYYHVGLVKAFLDANLLPRVVTGTSAGGLIAALVGTRTDEELREILVPRLADRLTSTDNEPFWVWMDRFRRTGARFDSVTWAEKSSWFTMAYERTGRVLNISVVPSQSTSPTKLLNYLTAPDCVIWSSLLASAAVPGILNPVVLMQKTRTGVVIPWSYGSRFKDGSIRSALHIRHFNFPVVSQVNPHIHLFFFAPRGSAGKPVAHRRGKGWRGGFILSAAEQYLKHDLTKNFKVIRDLELLPQLLGQDWSSVWLQRFDGVVTIWPRTRMSDWLKILSDPDRDELERMMHAGQSAAFPKLHMIENRARLEHEITAGRRAVRKATRNKSPLPATALEIAMESANAGGSSDRTIHQFPRVASGDSLAMESDVETAFARGEENLLGPPPLRGPRISLTAAAARAAAATAPEQSNVRRRQRAGSSHSVRSATTTITTPPSPTTPSANRNSSFFSRLKRTSVSSFTSPFGSLGRTRSKSTSSLSFKGDPDGPWSSDTSSAEGEFFEPDFELTPPPGRAEWDAARSAFPSVGAQASETDEEEVELNKQT
ncbi:patatin-domain-containing protein [Auriculariales sp. MPI-PUGE-AT-0066]|nr:patatin-domain-containing protein [Auriculariales sp. MPI-PUGE-AT-0066]